jgi:hypothetical protein
LSRANKKKAGAGPTDEILPVFIRLRLLPFLNQDETALFTKVSESQKPICDEVRAMNKLHANTFSSSLCNACFVEVASPTIHKKQKNEGNFDCFATADNYCDQVRCKYRRWCLHMEEAGEATAGEMAG